MTNNQMDKKLENKEAVKFWAPICISLGLSLIVVGITCWGNHLKGSWCNIGGGIFLLILGLILAYFWPKAKK